MNMSIFHQVKQCANIEEKEFEEIYDKMSFYDEECYVSACVKRGIAPSDQFLKKMKKNPNLKTYMIRLYLNPFGLTETFKFMSMPSVERVLDLSYEQFSVVHYIYSNYESVWSAPFINMPSEYFYLYLLARCKRDSVLHTEPENDYEVPYMNDDALFHFKPESTNDMIMRGFFGVKEDVILFGHIMGPKTKTRLSIDFPMFGITEGIYQELKGYWDIFDLIKEEKGCICILVKKALNEVREAARKSLMPLAFVGKELIEEPRVNVDVVPEKRVISLDSNFEPIPCVPCSSECCNEDVEYNYVMNSNPQLWSKTFKNVELVEEIDGEEVLLFRNGSSVSELTGQVPRLGIIEAVREDDRSNMSQGTNDFLDSLIGRMRSEQCEIFECFEPEDLDHFVCVEGEVWDKYVFVDGRVARSVDHSFYDLVLKPSYPMQSTRIDGVTKSNPGNPRTYDKFADIYTQVGLVSKTVDGSIPINVGKPNKNVKMLEISASPHGALRSAIDLGITDTYDYTNYERESHKELGLSYTQFCTNLVQGEISTDIKSIAADMERNVIGSDGRWERKPVINWPSPSMLVIDIPLKINSTTMYSMKAYGKGRKACQTTELIDDIPLAKVRAQCDLIRIVSSMLMSLPLRRGGSFLFKVIEPWSYRVIFDLYNKVACMFKSVTLVSTAYSKPLSKEIYFYFDDFYGRKVSYFSLEDFTRQVTVFMTREVAHLTKRLVYMSFAFGRDKFCPGKKAACRKDLYLKKCAIYINHHLGFTYKKPIPMGNRNLYESRDVHREILSTNDQSVQFLMTRYGLSYRVVYALIAYYQGDIDLICRKLNEAQRLE